MPFESSKGGIITYVHDSLDSSQIRFFAQAGITLQKKGVSMGLAIETKDDVLCDNFIILNPKKISDNLDKLAGIQYTKYEINRNVKIKRTELMPSIKDVAKEAGVSPTTISAVINQKPCVKPSTQQRVLAAIQKLNYTPNLSARELVTKEKQNVGLLLVSYDDPHTSFKSSPNSLYDIAVYEYVTQIAEYFGGEHYGLLLERFCYHTGSAGLPKMIEQKRVNVVFLVGALYSEELVSLLKEKISTVVAVGCSSLQTDYVCNDYSGSVRTAIRYLIQRGHRRIAYVDGDIASDVRPHKLLGYQLALQEAQIPYDPKLVFQSKILVHSGYDVAKQIWEQCEHPSAIFFGSDAIAIGAYQYFYEHNIRIPEDLSVFGYENLAISGFLQPPLSSVDLHKHEIADEACKIMLQKLQDQTSKTLGIMVGTEIVERNSVRTVS